MRLTNFRLSPSALEVGDNIRKLRIMNGHKQDWLANEINMSCVSLSKIENGKTDIPLSRLFEIATALDVDIKILFSDLPYLINH